MNLSINQIQKCTHALGLSESKKISYRNYYNSGYSKDSELEDLVQMGLCAVHDAGKERGGFYYHITESGINVMKQIHGNFRVKHD